MERSLWKREKERSVIDRHTDHLTDRETDAQTCLVVYLNASVEDGSLVVDDTETES